MRIRNRRKEKRQRAFSKAKEAVKEAIKLTFIVAFAFLLISYIRVNYFDLISASSGSMGEAVKEESRYLLDKRQSTIDNIKRFDIIVFDSPRKEQGNTLFVKRVIGMPGEVVYFDEQERLVIENVFEKTKMVLDEPYLEPTRQEWEKLHNDKYKFNMSFTKDNFIGVSPLGRGYVLGNEYFLMGDNRPSSSDSRGWWTIHSTHVRGVVTHEVYPTLTEIPKWEIKNEKVHKLPTRFDIFIKKIKGFFITL